MITRKNLLDRLRRYKKQRGLDYYAPSALGSPYPGQWVGEGRPMEFEEFLSWAVSRSVINGNDRTLLLVAHPPSTVTRVEATDSMTEEQLNLLLEDHAKLMRKAIDRSPHPVSAIRCVFRVLLAGA